ncbi:hypothetical protein MKX03_020581 [Papaver bracteatum]|nr:hypothetical protein MKX03_020581 [Papaver bracteatum]
MAELVAGAVLGAVVSEALRSAIHEKNMLKSFEASLEQFNDTLESVISKVEEIEIKGIDQVDKEISKLIMKLKEGKALVKECASVKSSDYYSQHRYSKKILELDNKLERFFQMEVQADMWCDIKQMWCDIKQIRYDIKQMWCDTKQIRYDIKQMWYDTKQIRHDIKQIRCDIKQIQCDIKQDLLITKMGTSTSTMNVGAGAADGDQGVHDPVEPGIQW